MELERFNKEIVFISKNAFRQNKIVAKDLRKYVSGFIKYEEITCIGGESYLYGLTNKNVKRLSHYTNSRHVLDNSIYNDKFYKKIISNNLIDYNSTNTNIVESNTLIINIAKLNTSLLKIINQRTFSTVVIINCHHFDFWKKIKLLYNYKLIKRRQFLTEYGFITVNIFSKKTTYVSLGSSCAVAYNLNRLGLRKESYPFDWCNLTIKKLNCVLENNFKDYDNLDIKKFSYNHSHLFLNSSGSFILKNKYNITFAHEILYEMNISTFKEKLNKRIIRFRKLTNVTFIMICHNTKDKQADLDRLVNELDKYFPNWELVLFTNLDFSKKDRIKIIKINNEFEFKDWKYSNLDWNVI